MADTEVTIRSLQKLALAYPHANLAPGTFGVYAEALQEVPDEILQLALKQAALECEFFPTLYRLREVITDILFGSVPTAEQAWEDVVRELKDEPRKYPKEKLIERGVDAIGGWFCLARSDNQMALRAQFLKIYASLRYTERQDLLTLKGVKDIRQQRLTERYDEPKELMPAPERVENAFEIEEDEPMSLT